MLTKLITENESMLRTPRRPDYGPSGLALTDAAHKRPSMRRRCSIDVIGKSGTWPS